MENEKPNPRARKSTPMKKKIFLKAFHKAHGIIQVGLDAADIHRTTYLKWYREDAKFANNVDTAEEAAIEFVESKLYDNVSAGKERSVVFYLKSRSEKYKEKTEVDLNMNQPIKIEIIKPD